MNRRGCLMAFGVVFCLLLLVLVYLAYPYYPYRWNQRLVITIQTPNGDKVGSSVGRVSWAKNTPFAASNGRPWKQSFDGEATVVDLGNNKYLFASIKNAPFLAFLSAYGSADGGSGNRVEQISSAVGKIFRIYPDAYPTLVTFENIGDPETVRQVDPTYLVGTFGDGYAIRSITLEITKDSVTEGKVENLLTWWPTFRGGPFNSMKSLKLPNNSPRGWRHLGVREFWSLKRIKGFNGKFK